MPIFSSPNGRFSFARFVGTKVAGNDDVVVAGIVGDVVGAEVKVLFVMPAGSVDVTSGGVVVDGIGGKVRGGSVLHRVLKSEVPDKGVCQFPRN